MKVHAVILLILSGAALASPVTELLPSDIAAFVEERDLCDHFRGEEPYDEERRQFLEKNIVELCTGTDARLSSLKKKYHGNQSVLTLLAEYEVDIEPSR